MGESNQEQLYTGPDAYPPSPTSSARSDSARNDARTPAADPLRPGKRPGLLHRAPDSANSTPTPMPADPAPRPATPITRPSDAAAPSGAANGANVNHVDDPGADAEIVGMPGMTEMPDEATFAEGGIDSSGFDPQLIWQMVLSELAMHMPTATYDTWVRDTWVVAYEDGEFIIGMPNAFARDWLENRLRHTIKRTLGSIVKRSVQIQFRVYPRQVVDPSVAEPTPLYRPARDDLSHPMRDSMREPMREETSKPRSASAVEKPDPYSSQLNPQHTFETFVVGSHNRLAHAAALAVVDQPGQTFNPLFIYGGVGLGKTHLLNAIGNAMRKRGFNMIYCSSEQFTNDLITSIRGQNTEQFRNKYRQIDVLLIDDIQFIGGKESTQEEFFHTFNHLHAAGRQIVISSDRPPKALATLEERLRSRFEGGLQTDIAQPDFETRVAILQSKANRMGVPVSYEVLLLVAERVDSNIRELEGALNRLFLQARMANAPLTAAFARTIVDNLAPQRVACPPATLLRIVAEHFHLRGEELTGRKRTKEVANARQIAMYLLREEHDLSLPAIGELLGGRDHTTIRYGVEKVTEDVRHDEALRMTILTLRDKIYVPDI